MHRNQRNTKSQSRNYAGRKRQRQTKQLQVKVDPKIAEYQNRLNGILNSGWSTGGWYYDSKGKKKERGHYCPAQFCLVNPSFDIGDLPTSYKDMTWKTRDNAHKYFRGLYIHGHLDDPTIKEVFWKDLPLPAWWWIISNKESD